MKIALSSLIVSDQQKALEFYTQKLGFIKKTEVPMGEYSWLTVVSPEHPDGVELVLEPTAFPPSQVYQKALFDANIPLTAFQVEDINSEFNKLSGLGVEFPMKPTEMGPTIVAIFDDTCGNKIQMYQMI
jgi:predicted enzyme related to lactoylglutathione lyase